MASDSYCNGCIYKGVVEGHVPCCNYIFIEDKPRPCPPGEGCTVKLTSKEIKKRKAKERRGMSVEAMQRKKERDRLYREKKKAYTRKLCRYCGKEFTPLPGNYFFCSEECKEAQSRENRRKADSRREEKRKAARAAAKEKCQ
jgi:hypothetical protein